MARQVIFDPPGRSAQGSQLCLIRLFQTGGSAIDFESPVMLDSDPSMQKLSQPDGESKRWIKSSTGA